MKVTVERKPGVDYVTFSDKGDRIEVLFADAPEKKILFDSKAIPGMILALKAIQKDKNR